MRWSAKKVMIVESYLWFRRVLKLSKKLNVMVDVSQEVYDSVVVPHKQNKTFSILVGALLQSYYSNSGVRGCVADIMDGVNRQTDDILGSIIGSMHDSLASMGVYTNDLQATAQDGLDAFGRAGDRARKSYNESSMTMQNMQDMANEGNINQPVQAIPQAIPHVDDDLRNTVEVLKNQNEEIMSMLKSMLSNGSVVSASKSVQGSIESVEVVEKSDAVTVPVEAAQSGYSEPVHSIAVTKQETIEGNDEGGGAVGNETGSETSTEEAFNILSMLMDGNVAEY